MGGIFTFSQLLFPLAMPSELHVLLFIGSFSHANIPPRDSGLSDMVWDSYIRSGRDIHSAYEHIQNTCQTE